MQQEMVVTILNNPEDEKQAHDRLLLSSAPTHDIDVNRATHRLIKSGHSIHDIRCVHCTPTAFRATWVSIIYYRPRRRPSAKK